MDRVPQSVTRGFTLIELIVVCAIMVLVTAMVFANNTKFGGRVLLQNLAYDTALSIRQAQVYGISVAKTGGAYASAYGIHFTANSTTFRIFADTYPVAPSPYTYAGDGVYESNDVTVGQPYNIGRGYKVIQLCDTRAGVGATESCSLSTIDIVFQRPNPDACIYDNTAASVSIVQNNGSYTCTGISPTIVRARVVLQSPQGDKMCAIIYTTGQISVQNC